VQQRGEPRVLVLIANLREEDRDAAV
jgi:hypothetical protein